VYEYRLVGFAVEISGVEMMVHHMISATGFGAG
jgi:hypothetical protein